MNLDVSMVIEINLNYSYRYLAKINNTKNNEIMFYLYKGTKRTSIEWIYTQL